MNKKNFVFNEFMILTTIQNIKTIVEWIYMKLLKYISLR